MGEGIVLTCKECGHTYGVMEGIGFNYPTTYERVSKDIAEGKYGTRLRDAYLAPVDPIVDAEDHVYLCRGCGHWEVSPGLDIYSPLPQPGTSGKTEIKNPSTFCFHPRGWCHNSYISARYHHMCPQCGRRMARATNKEKLNLKCPKCGGIPETDTIESVCWD